VLGPPFAPKSSSWHHMDIRPRRDTIRPIKGVTDDMGDLDWRFDKPEIVFLLTIYAVIASVLMIAAGYLLHVGWDTYGS
jgi:hypothetical protein